MTTYAAARTICDKKPFAKAFTAAQTVSFLHYFVRTDHFCEIQYQLTL